MPVTQPKPQPHQKIDSFACHIAYNQHLIYHFHSSSQVAQQCKENIFAIETLKNFQYVEDGKDHGMNVREKAKQLVQLLKDDERLRNERAKALKAKERFAQNTMGIGSAGVSGLRIRKNYVGEKCCLGKGLRPSIQNCSNVLFHVSQPQILIRSYVYGTCKSGCLMY